MWDVRTGKAAGSQIEHGSRIYRVSFSPDGNQLATAGSDGAVRLWGTATGQLIADPLRHPSPCLEAYFSPDGRFLLTRCDDELERIWAVPPHSAGRVPDWLLRLATLQAGTMVNEDGVLTEPPAGQISWAKVRAEVNALPDTVPFAAWGKWLLADRAQRPLAPGFALTLAEAETRGLLIAPVTAAPVDETAATPSPLQ